MAKSDLQKYQRQIKPKVNTGNIRYMRHRTEGSILATLGTRETEPKGQYWQHQVHEKQNRRVNTDNSTKNLMKPKLYMNPTKNLIEDKLHMNPTKNLI